MRAVACRHTPLMHRRRYRVASGLVTRMPAAVPIVTPQKCVGGSGEIISPVLLVVLATMSCRGYTNGMKTAISLPDEVFDAAERFARRVGKSRSQVYAEALAEYLARHGPDEVTAAMNTVVDEVGEGSDGFVGAAARRTLERVEW